MRPSEWENVASRITCSLTSVSMETGRRRVFIPYRSTLRRQKRKESVTAVKRLVLIGVKSSLRGEAFVRTLSVPDVPIHTQYFMDLIRNLRVHSMASGFQGEKVKQQMRYISSWLSGSLQTARSMFNTHQLSEFAVLPSLGILLCLCCKTSDFSGCGRPIPKVG